jgi:hypothetical protein
MSQMTFAPVADFQGAVRAERTVRGSRLGGILSGLLFMGARLPFYVGAALVAGVVCLVGVTLYAVQAALGGQRE